MSNQQGRGRGRSLQLASRGAHHQLPNQQGRGRGRSLQLASRGPQRQLPNQQGRDGRRSLQLAPRGPQQQQHQLLYEHGRLRGTTAVASKTNNRVTTAVASHNNSRRQAEYTGKVPTGALEVRPCHHRPGPTTIEREGFSKKQKTKQENKPNQHTQTSLAWAVFVGVVMVVRGGGDDGGSLSLS